MLVGRRRTNACLFGEGIPGKFPKQERIIRQLGDRSDKLDLKRGGPTAEGRIRDRIEKLRRFETICGKIQWALAKEIEASHLKTT